MYGHLITDEALLVGDKSRSRSSGPTGQGFADASFPNSQLDLVLAYHGGELGVGAFGEDCEPVSTSGPSGLNRRHRRIGHPLHSVWIPHINRMQRW